MAEYIDRGEIREKFVKAAVILDGTFGNHKRVLEGAIKLLDEAPTTDVAPVVHGRWVPMSYDGYADGYPVWDEFECSECGYEHSGDDDTLTNYCPNCGAKMDGKEAEERDGNQ